MSTPGRVTRILEEAPFSMNDLARETGLSYDALRSWATGRRNPKAKSLEKLAAYLDRHGKQLQEFAAEVRGLADELRRVAE